MPAPMNLERVFSVLVSRDVDGFLLPRHSQRPINVVIYSSLGTLAGVHTAQGSRKGFGNE